MTIKVVCPKCLKIAFEYYVGDDAKNDIFFPKPIPCDHCGREIKKIDISSGTLWKAGK